MNETPLTKLIDDTARELYAMEGVDLSLETLQIVLCKFAKAQLEIIKKSLTSETVSVD